MRSIERARGISHHFRREARLMAALFLIVVVLGALVGLFAPALFR